ncbi:methyltransferase family protein [Tuwongella immobilis]|uniref:Isoprenylcysteine carboxylmethyltransferase family protein n=1 Tax=Tuwongella immobilis TaxID=692036 RepID=A0A6C2YHT6_9BACT|nr:isoprenylcysteine carboxylmethyltransferase family protein [Tuwongella immobilis]VIP01090.1 Uncharacterized protein OS=Leifsonia aquatica ATCC 14665 GN=N136_03157 PE=4 SV=1: PEMT [Tuwongella immobilis]VTR97605.1 Uncharacterized protein OS=Leifsonia aquatica ATCC 14665 GN=N136_03157 PE=4 SV=1: PEMT [Tuwongella immobilis]
MDRFRFAREARPTSRTWILAKTFAQTVIFWSGFLALLPAIIWRLEDHLGLAGWRFSTAWNLPLGCVLFALGGTLGLTSGYRMAIHGKGTPLPMDCARELVLIGPYRYVRNPMAIGGLTQGFAVGLAMGSPAVMLVPFVGGPIWNHWVRPWEEADLERRFGESYRHYRQSVTCWLPRWTGYDPPQFQPASQTNESVPPSESSRQ